jgi:hypothetical protein
MRASTIPITPRTAGVTGDKPLPLIPPLWVPLAEVAWWLQKMHRLTESKIRDVVVDLRRIPMNFQVDDEIITGWGGWEVDWEVGRARWKQDPDGIDYPLQVSWGAATDAVKRMRREQLALQAPAPGPAAAAGELETNAANAGKPPFDANKALALLKATRDSGLWPDAPTEGVTRDLLLHLFSGVSNDPHRDIRREVWPGMHRGPRANQRRGGLTDKKR